jgi:hypothetical protein
LIQYSIPVESTKFPSLNFSLKLPIVTFRFLDFYLTLLQAHLPLSLYTGTHLPSFIKVIGYL